MAAEIRDGVGRGVKVFFADAVCTSDLAEIASLWDEKGLLLVGSSGLAEVLAEIVGRIELGGTGTAIAASRRRNRR